MLILLPPSEGKSCAADGPPVNLAELSFPELNPIREEVLAALGDVCCGQNALGVLGLSRHMGSEVERMRALAEAATLPAGDLYTGVLYQQLGLPTLALEARDRADRSIVIVSALWGALRTTDRIPPYRLAMNVNLPPVGALAAKWRPGLTEVIRPDGQLVVDMRSANYQLAWKPGAADAPNVVGVKVVRERILRGVPKRSTVSHMAKAYRGKIARSLLEYPEQPETPEQLLKVLSDLGYVVEQHAGAPAVLEVIFST